MKKKVGKLFGRPIVYGGDSSELKSHEIKLDIEEKKIKLSVLDKNKEQVISISGKEVKPFNYQDYTIVVYEPAGPNEGVLIDMYNLDSQSLVFNLTQKSIPYIHLFVVNNKKIPIQKILQEDENGELTDIVYFESDWLEPICAIYQELPNTTSERISLSLLYNGIIYGWINDSVADKNFSLELVLIGDPLGTKFHLDFI